MNNDYNNLFIDIIDSLTVSNSDNRLICANNDIDAIKVWLSEFINSKNTFISYKQCVERFLIWLNTNSLNLRNVKREDILLYQNFLVDPQPTHIWCGPAVSRENKNWKPFVKGLTSTSIKLNLQILSTMFEYLVLSGYLSLNPLKLMKIKSANLTILNKKIENYLPHKEWDLVSTYLKNIKSFTDKEKLHNIRKSWIFHLLYYTGCRRHEIINAKMSDFIIKNNRWWIKVIGKGNKYGEIPVNDQLLVELQKYRQSINLPLYPQSRENSISIVNNISKNKLKGISDSMLYKIIKITCEEISNYLSHTEPLSANIIKQVSTHWLRHTSATHQVDAGIDIRVVKQNLRHTLIETTMRYQHKDDEERHEETIKKFI